MYNPENVKVSFDVPKVLIKCVKEGGGMGRLEYAVGSGESEKAKWSPSIEGSDRKYLKLENQELAIRLCYVEKWGASVQRTKSRKVTVAS